ncbi:hypothetical protein D3X57_19865 [Acinetobacter baumannii]|nr:hypothetical protein CVD09_15800 [Acinetobacter seifertii]RIX34705.1 hypothetical protein D3X57_19865 [Acinetobacter baumannii]RIX39225.1 hypothetical protein D3X54_17580 [Acinetobacter baumannii]RJO32794.1 hypothetical protein D3X44_16230 [Acinetobacter baumannii]
MWVGGYPPILAYWWRHLILYIDKEGRNDLSTIDRIQHSKTIGNYRCLSFVNACIGLFTFKKKDSNKVNFL